MTKGARNLAILGVAAVVASAVLTAVSLAIYHYSGDIYLDRSRPGFLPDEEEVKQNEEDDEGEYDYDENAELTGEMLDEYLEMLQIEVKALDGYADPFGEKALSDERLGI